MPTSRAARPSFSSGARGAADAIRSLHGTDGPTDAAGGYVDGGTAAALARAEKSAAAALAENDAYPTLNAVGGLIKTGPTGTNVNDVAVVLIRG